MPYNVYTIKGNAGFLTPSAAGIDPKIENELICDPIQGNVSDCFFLAALGSCAWNTTSLAPTIPIKPGNNFAASFDIPLWSNGALQKTTVSNKLFLGANGMPVYAQPTPQNEIWVAIYEKAFAKFKGCSPIDPEGNPDISKLPWGSALDALVNLTNKKYSFTAAPLPQTAFSTKNAPPSPFNGQNCVDYYDIIKTVCSPNAASPSSGKTNKPMVAWTYDSEPLEWKNKGFLYRYPTINPDRMLIAKHTYSILGYYTSGGNKYIVLRDPLGKWGTKSPQEDPVIKAYLPSAPSNWDPVQDHAKFPIRDIAPCPSGVFGLKVDAFKGCFSGFGWVQ